MTPRRSPGLWVVVVVSSLAWVGCGPAATAPEDPPPTDVSVPEPAASGRDDGAYTAYGCPFQTLLPQDSRDTCAMRIIAQAFSGLTTIDPDSGEPELLVAESVETEDSVVWRIEIADGWTFHDGEPVTARSFVDAWNVAADPDRDLRNASFLAEIAGYDAVRAGEADTLAGVVAVDERTIEVTLDEPFAPFFAKLADPAFAPLPTIAFEDLDAYARQPIGNGRYRIASHDPDREVRLERFEDWGGEVPGEAERVTVVIYVGDTASETAYQDVRAGALDVLDQVPPDRLDDLEEELDGRFVTAATSSVTFLGLPLHEARFADDVALRQALSLSIDRARIVEEVYGGFAEPAGGVIPPVLDAHRRGACDACRYDPSAARELLDEAGGWDGPLTVYYNSGAGHDEWMRAVGDAWTAELGIGPVVTETMDFASYTRLLDRRAVEGPFRYAWSLSYLSPEYAMSDLFRSDGSSNHFGFASAAFDEALDVANAAPPGEADTRYQEAEDILLTELPVIPLWYSQAVAVHGPRVSGVSFDATSMVRLDRVRVLD